MAGQPIRSNPAPLEIYFLPDVDPGKKSSTHVYQKIFEGSIFGAGKNNVTSLPELTNPVVIPAGSSYSFYITVANYTLGTTLYYHKNLGGVGSVMASDEYMEVLQGYALAYPFFAYSGDWRWNGEEHSINKDFVIWSLRTHLYCYSFILPRQCVLLCRGRAVSNVNDYSHHDGNAESNNIAANFIEAHDIDAHEIGPDTPANNETANAAGNASANIAAYETANISADIGWSDTQTYNSTNFAAT